MSIIQTVRDKYLWVVSVAIALSVIGFLLMDARSGSKGRDGGGGANETIASVNGRKITYGEYTAMAKTVEENYTSQGRPVDDATRQQINQQVWSQLSDGTIIDQEIAKIGFALTDKEISDQMFVSNIPEFLKQEFTNQQTQQFDIAAARNAVAQLKKRKDTDPQKQKIEKTLIDPYVEQLLRKKYFALLQASAYVPKWLAEKEMADNNAIANFQFVNVPYSSIPDSTVKVSDDQIDTYLKRHKKQYSQDEVSRSIAYVSFAVQPSAADSANTLKNITALKPGFQQAPDAGKFVTRNVSDIQFLDGFTAKTKLMMPAKDSITAAAIGNVYGPYMDGNAWVLSRIIEIRNLPDSVKVRHILIGTMDPRTQQPTRDEASAKVKIDSIFTAIKGGADFNAMVLQFSDDEGSKTTGGVYDYFAEGKMAPEFTDSSFQGKVGDYKVVRTQYGYHLINILGQKGMQPSYKIAYMAKSIVPSSETISDISNKAMLFAGNSRSMKDFEENIKKNNYVRLIAPDIKPVDYTIPGVGDSRSLVRWIYDNDPGEVSEPQDLKDKFVVAAVTGVEEPGLQSAAKARPLVESIIRNEEKAKLLRQKIGVVSTLEGLAAAQKLQVQTADSVAFGSAVLPGAGPEAKVVGAAFNKAGLNKVSSLIDGGMGIYAVKPTMIGAKPPMGTTLEEQRKQMESQLKQSSFSVITALHKAANIKDNRSKYL